MERQSAWFVLSALATAACSSPMTSSPATTDVPTTDMVTVTDNGSDTDVQSPVDRPSTQDGGAMDVPTTTDGSIPDVPKITDSPTSDVPRIEGGRVNPCAAGSIVDLNARGTLTGTVTRYAGNNRGVSASPAIVPPCGSINLAQVVHRYVPRTTSRLRVSTNNTGTPANFDTVAFAQTTCGGTTSLGCNDDVSPSMMIISSAFSTTGAVTAGTPVFITVAGYSSPDTGRIGEGDYVLTVDELPVVAAGGACDTAGVTSGCAVGATCLVPSTADGGTAGTCVADGAAMGLCRAATSTTPPATRALRARAPTVV